MINGTLNMVNTPITHGHLFKKNNNVTTKQNEKTENTLLVLYVLTDN